MVLLAMATLRLFTKLHTEMICLRVIFCSMMSFFQYVLFTFHMSMGRCIERGTNIEDKRG